MADVHGRIVEDVPQLKRGALIRQKSVKRGGK